MLEIPLFNIKHDLLKIETKQDQSVNGNIYYFMYQKYFPLIG